MQSGKGGAMIKTYDFLKSQTWALLIKQLTCTHLCETEDEAKTADNLDSLM